MWEKILIEGVLHRRSHSIPLKNISWGAGCFGRSCQDLLLACLLACLGKDAILKMCEIVTKCSNNCKFVCNLQHRMTARKRPFKNFNVILSKWVCELKQIHIIFSILFYASIWKLYFAENPIEIELVVPEMRSLLASQNNEIQRKLITIKWLLLASS